MSLHLCAVCCLSDYASGQAIERSVKSTAADSSFIILYSAHEHEHDLSVSVHQIYYLLQCNWLKMLQAI